MDKRDIFIKPGRPRLEVDYALVLNLRDEKHLGWLRGSERYREISGQWISRDTFKRRYYELKNNDLPIEGILAAVSRWEIKI